jgi:pseudouridine-5'-phosphate glycosidase
MPPASPPDDALTRGAADFIEIAPEVAAAIADLKPVVAIESALVNPAGRYPDNTALYGEIAAAMRETGVVPALVSIIDGRILVGHSPDQIERLGRAMSVAKAGKRELAMVLANGGVASTTVSATLFIAGLCGIRIAMTGAIGGVHRDFEETLDVSADLGELGRTPVAIVCTGAKIILDLPRTLEFLETSCVPVVGFRVSNFPAYFCGSGLAIDRIDDPARIAALLDTHWSLGINSGVVVAAPPPATEFGAAALESIVAAAMAQARADGISGKAVTPYLLRQVDTATAGESERIRRVATLAVGKAAAEVASAYASRRSSNGISSVSPQLLRAGAP